MRKEKIVEIKSKECSLTKLVQSEEDPKFEGSLLKGPGKFESHLPFHGSNHRTPLTPIVKNDRKISQSEDGIVNSLETKWFGRKSMTYLLSYHMTPCLNSQLVQKNTVPKPDMCTACQTNPILHHF